MVAFLEKLIDMIRGFLDNMSKEVALAGISHIPARGDNSKEVELIQEALNKKGAKLTVDGDFGAKTEKAVKAFKESNDLESSGVIGSYTLKLLGFKVMQDVEPDRPSIPPVIVDGKFEEPEFVVVKGVRFNTHGNYKTTTGMFRGLTVHYTVSGRTAKSAVGVLKYLAKKGLGCMVMDEDGKIYIPEGFDPLKSVAWHAGDSAWEGRTGMSRYMAGMEICCWGRGSKVGPYRTSKGEANIIAGQYQTYAKAQEASLINFCLWALDVNPEFIIGWIAGHDEVRAAAGKPGGKQDPGASLSMTMPEFRALIKRESK